MKEGGSSSVNGTLILVLGILGIVCRAILAPVAWVMGNNALTSLNQGGGDESQRGLVGCWAHYGHYRQRVADTANVMEGVLRWFSRSQ